jgi:hypothetical protein
MPIIHADQTPEVEGLDTDYRSELHRPTHAFPLAETFSKTQYSAFTTQLTYLSFFGIEGIPTFQGKHSILNGSPLIFHSNFATCLEISVFLQSRKSINKFFSSSSITNYPRRLSNDLRGRQIHELHTREKSGSKIWIATGG